MVPFFVYCFVLFQVWLADEEKISFRILCLGNDCLWFRYVKIWICETRHYYSMYIYREKKALKACTIVANLWMWAYSHLYMGNSIQDVSSSDHQIGKLIKACAITYPPLQRKENCQGKNNLAKAFHTYFRVLIWTAIKPDLVMGFLQCRRLMTIYKEVMPQPSSLWISLFIFMVGND